MDYVQSLLLNDPCTIPQRIIDKIIIDPAAKKKFTRMLEVTQNFLKVQYALHAKFTDGFCTHGIKFAFTKAIENESSDNDSEGTKSSSKGESEASKSSANKDKLSDSSDNSGFSDSKSEVLSKSSNNESGKSEIIRYALMVYKKRAILG